jgi:kynureninase
LGEIKMITRQECETRDLGDKLGHLRARYHVPEGMIYLDGNSLGLMPKAAAARVKKAVEQEWAEDLITSWNKHGWMQLPRIIGGKIAPLIGAAPADVIVTDTISVNVFKLLTAALALRPDRNIILSDNGNFPSDLYAAQGLTHFLGRPNDLRVVEPENVADAIDDGVAVVMLTAVDYRTARLHDMAAITRRAHERGALVIWDLAHSAGAIPVDVTGADADFALGCTYKYLNGGPGAQSFIYVHPRWQNEVTPALVGWWGHAAPFAFSPHYEPAPGIGRYQSGTQSVLGMHALDAALDQWFGVSMMALKAKSDALCETFIALVEQHCASYGITLIGPRAMAERGAHVSFRCPEGYAVMQALIARRVIGDFRAPDMIRFGFAASYNTFVDAFDAAGHLAAILETRAWDTPQFRTRKAVT